MQVGPYWIGVHNRLGLVIFSISEGRLTAETVLLWLVQQKAEVRFARAEVKAGLKPASAVPEFAARDFSAQIAEYERYLAAHPYVASLGVTEETPPDIQEFEEGTPRPGWFTDEGWRRMRGRYRYDSR
jgi:hypothetical protein